MADSDASIMPAADDIPKAENFTQVGVVSEERGRLQVQEHKISVSESARRKIHIAAASGNWIEALSYSRIPSQWWRIPLNGREMTALHVAVSMRKTSFAEKLVNCMEMHDLEIPMVDGNTAFCLAAMTGNVKIAGILLRKNRRLPWIRGQNNMLPIQLASSAGHISMAEFLFQALPLDLHNSMPFQDIANLFFFTIDNNIYSVASKLLNRYPKLATMENEGGFTALQMLAQISSSQEAIGDEDIVRSLFKGMGKEEESLNYAKLSTAMFDAAKYGNTMILKFIFKYYPELLFEVDSTKQRNLLHIAILHRQEAVYKLILKQGDFKNMMVQLVDFNDNNVLHLAAKLEKPEQKFGLSTNYVQMRTEETWFKEVQKIVPPSMKTKKNKDGLTPIELFHQSHKELHKESASELKSLANTLIVVATLIITLGISVAITIPLNDIDSTLTPIFRKKTWYIIFFISVGLETSFCAASMLFYASAILPSNVEPQDESIRLQENKVRFGSVTLFISAGFMLVASIASATLIFEFLSSWSPYFTFGVGVLVFILHFTLDHALWSKYISHLVLTLSKVTPVKFERLFGPISKVYKSYHPLQKRRSLN
ncbi:hypothetical protein VIGAN_05057000 [Vigna angularis var. angularis]|uniref:PGG domain-containing protein n=1 Tax=Vigna angularis var. angularis TaxID=157739 RepID=A0A0S3S342_PHAAN|nr:hypothetical protein VIGAN_05057000 [Vigna angularis var. angularis]